MSYFRKEEPYTSRLNHVKGINPPLGAPMAVKGEINKDVDKFKAKVRGAKAKALKNKKG